MMMMMMISSEVNFDGAFNFVYRGYENSAGWKIKNRVREREGKKLVWDGQGAWHAKHFSTGLKKKKKKKNMRYRYDEGNMTIPKHSLGGDTSTRSEK